MASSMPSYIAQHKNNMTSKITITFELAPEQVESFMTQFASYLATETVKKEEKETVKKEEKENEEEVVEENEEVEEKEMKKEENEEEVVEENEEVEEKEVKKEENEEVEETCKAIDEA